MLSKSKLGFSLIELSVVILVIGILVIGITRGSRIISETKLKSAQSLTNNSPVASISNLILWLETTSDKSFVNNISNGNSIAIWYDLSQQNNIKNNAIGSGAPIYTTNVLNGLPVVRFDGSDGSNDFFTFDGSNIVGRNYSIFLVSTRRSSQNTNMILGGTASSGFQNLHFGYYLNGTPRMRIAHYSDGASGTDYIDYAVPVYSSPQFQIHSYTFNSGIGRTYYQNSIQKSFINSSGAKTGLISWNGSAIGRFVTHYFIGDVAEVIIFNKSLSNNERNSVEQYLGQKWGILLQ